MQHDVYMWRDALDKNQFWIGVQSSNKRDYCGWLPVFIDAINECFGEEAYEVAKAIKPGAAERIHLTLTFVA